MPKKKTAKRKKKKEAPDVTALITVGADVSRLVGCDKDDLTKWFNAYLGIESSEGSHTHRAKVGDVEWFLKFFHEDSGGYHCDDWTPGRTKTFTRWIAKQKSERTKKRLASSTCQRIFDTVKHAAGWIHRHRPFLAGSPFEGAQSITVDEPEWYGLSDLEVRRLKAAAEQLIHLKTRASQLPLRNYTILLVLLDSGLRAFELCDLEPEQFHRKALCDIRRKGRITTKKIPLSSDAASALKSYVAEERVLKEGPLFQSKTGKAISQQVIDQVIRRIAAQANCRLSEDDQIVVSPHVLRHTALRKWTEKKGVRFAQKIAGHASDRYIWRYITPSEEDVQHAVDSLWD